MSETIAFHYEHPTSVYFEKEAVKNHPEVWKAAGARALILTGKHSAKACGALQDVVQTLAEGKIVYTVFDEVENNPSTETVTKAAAQGREFRADFIIGIGGGSPIDAAKAVGVLIANPQMSVMDLFQNQFDRVLPVIAVPTTAGTGSEVTQYSVLLVKAQETKLSFGTKRTLPQAALLDVKYTYSMSFQSVKNTAVDAFTHCLESFLSNRSTAMSEILAREGIRIFGECIAYLTENQSRTHKDQEAAEKTIKEKLMMMSMLGGMVIQMTGVTLVHAMGYCYTFFQGIPHGMANGLLVSDYLEYIYHTITEKVEQALALMKYQKINDLREDLTVMLGEAPKLTEEEAVKYASLTMMQKGSIANTACKTGQAEIEMLWRMAGNCE